MHLISKNRIKILKSKSNFSFLIKQSKKYNCFSLSFLQNKKKIFLRNYHIGHNQQESDDSTDLYEQIKNLEIEAEKGDSDSLNKLGSIYLFGKGIEKDINKGIEYLTLAAKGENHIAMNTLGNYYSEQNDQKSLEYYQKAAELGEYKKKLF